MAAGPVGIPILPGPSVIPYSRSLRIIRLLLSRAVVLLRSWPRRLREALTSRRER